MRRGLRLIRLATKLCFTVQLSVKLPLAPLSLCKLLLGLSDSKRGKLPAPQTTLLRN